MNLAVKAAVVLMMLSVFGCGPAAVDYTPVEVGDTAPDFLLEDLDKIAVSSDSIEGEFIVLSFWSTSCANCIREMDELNQIQSSGAATVVGIALDDDPSRVRTLLEKKPVNYQILMGDQAVFERFDGFNIPYTLVLDQDRRIRKKFMGPMSKADFEATVGAEKVERVTQATAQLIQ